MPTRFPLEPFRVPDETPVCDRVALMNALADDGVGAASVAMLAEAVLARVRGLVGAMRAAAASGDIASAVTVRTSGWIARIIAAEALLAAQSLPYMDDPDGQEWFAAADYTLRHGGDCDDLTIAFVALARALGLQAEPVWITQEGQDLNHVTARVRLGDVWYWADPSIRGAALGESPYEAVQRLGTGARVGVAGGASQVVHARSPGPNGLPFAWDGWTRLWGRWPTWWWRAHYPLLGAPPAEVSADPRAHGLYRVSFPDSPFGAVPLGTRRMV